MPLLQDNSALQGTFTKRDLADSGFAPVRYGY